MQTENIFIAHPTTSEQIDALKAVVKAFNVKFEIMEEPLSEYKELNKNEILENIQQGAKEMKLIQKGEIKGTSLHDFLNEL
jgi:arginine/ornithine N-succinyltransferase beta subunit